MEKPPWKFDPEFLNHTQPVEFDTKKVAKLIKDSPLPDKGLVDLVKEHLGDFDKSKQGALWGSPAKVSEPINYPEADKPEISGVDENQMQMDLEDGPEDHSIER